MGFATEIADAAAEAQNILARLGGMAEDAAGNFVGPDGRTYTMTIRAADAFETQAAGLQMQSHGSGVQSILIATATRDQFSADPIGWRGQRGTMLYPARRSLLISSVAIDDSAHYAFTLIARQGA